MQLFGLNYRSIIDPMDLEWYTTKLEDCKSLNINNFLYDVNLYVVNCILPPQHAASRNVFDLSRPTVVPCHHLVKMEIFGLGGDGTGEILCPSLGYSKLGNIIWRKEP